MYKLQRENVIENTQKFPLIRNLRPKYLAPGSSKVNARCLTASPVPSVQKVTGKPTNSKESPKRTFDFTFCFQQLVLDVILKSERPCPLQGFIQTSIPITEKALAIIKVWNC